MADGAGDSRARESPVDPRSTLRRPHRDTLDAIWRRVCGVPDRW